MQTVRNVDRIGQSKVCSNSYLLPFHGHAFETLWNICNF